MKPYAQRVIELEAEGLCTSDAQAAADAEAIRGVIEHDAAPALRTNQTIRELMAGALMTGRIYHLTFAHKRDGVRVEETFTARVNWQEQRDGYTYFGYTPLKPLEHGLFGAARLYAVPQPFGLQRVRRAS